MKEPNDSRFVGLSIYNMLVLCATGVPLVYIAQDIKELVFGIVAAFILFGSSFTLAMLFVPKVWQRSSNHGISFALDKIRKILFFKFNEDFYFTVLHFNL